MIARWLEILINARQINYNSEKTGVKNGLDLLMQEMEFLTLPFSDPQIAKITQAFKSEEFTQKAHFLFIIYELHVTVANPKQTTFSIDQVSIINKLYQLFVQMSVEQTNKNGWVLKHGSDLTKDQYEEGLKTGLHNYKRKYFELRDLRRDLQNYRDQLNKRLERIASKKGAQSSADFNTSLPPENLSEEQLKYKAMYQACEKLGAQISDLDKCIDTFKQKGQIPLDDLVALRDGFRTTSIEQVKLIPESKNVVGRILRRFSNAIVLFTANVLSLSFNSFALSSRNRLRILTNNHSTLFDHVINNERARREVLEKRKAAEEQAKIMQKGPAQAATVQPPKVNVTRTGTFLEKRIHR